MKIIAIVVIPVLIILGVSGWRILDNKDSEKNSVSKSVLAKTLAAKTSSKSNFDKAQYSNTSPSSIWVVVNKQRPIQPKDYKPSDLVVPSVRLRVPGNESMQLRANTTDALEEMVTAAHKDGIELMLSSGFRSYAYQESLYNGYVKSQGQAVADTQSARPGYSEHQTGLAVDLRTINGTCELQKCFGDLPEGKWLADNAYKYGFIIRYSNGSKPTVGYEYEPWHVRYIGKSAAEEYHKTNATTLEDFFNLPAAPDYKK